MPQPWNYALDDQVERDWEVRTGQREPQPDDDAPLREADAAEEADIAREWNRIPR